MQYTGIGLAARLLGAGPESYLTDFEVEPGILGVLGFSPFTGMWTINQEVGKFPGNPNFPYGWTVEPD